MYGIMIMMPIATLICSTSLSSIPEFQIPGDNYPEIEIPTASAPYNGTLCFRILPAHRGERGTPEHTFYKPRPGMAVIATRARHPSSHGQVWAAWEFE